MLYRVVLCVLCLCAVQLTAADSPSFTRDVQPVLQERCIVCHSEPIKAGGLLLGNYQQLMAGGGKGKVVVPGKADDSRLIRMLDGRDKPQMPQGGPYLDKAAIELIRAWIDAGANAPAAGEAARPTTPVAVPDVKPLVLVHSQVGALAFSPDGRVVAVGRYKTVELIDAESHRVIARLEGHADVVRSLAFSPDGRTLAAGAGLPARSGQIKLWDVASQKELRTIDAHADSVYGLAFSPDGRLLASAGYDRLVKTWDPATGALQKTLKDHIDAVLALAFSPDGKRLASGSVDRTVKVWDPATGERLYTLSDAEDAVYAIAWRPSGKQIAAGGADKTLRTWDVWDGQTPGGKMAQSITGHEDVILQVAYSPDGKSLVTASADHRIKIWDPDTLIERRTLEAQPDWVLALRFSPDGKSLALGRYDGSIVFYELSRPSRSLAIASRP